MTLERGKNQAQLTIKQLANRHRPPKLKKTKRLKPCWHCGALTPFVCARCKKPVCVLGYYFGGPKLMDVKAACSTLRKRRSEAGVYLLCCWPKCVKRRSKVVLDQLAKEQRDRTQAARDMYDDMMGLGNAEDDKP